MFQEQVVWNTAAATATTMRPRNMRQVFSTYVPAAALTHHLHNLLECTTTNKKASSHPVQTKAMCGFPFLIASFNCITPPNKLQQLCVSDSWEVYSCLLTNHISYARHEHRKNHSICAGNCTIALFLVGVCKSHPFPHNLWRSHSFCHFHWRARGFI